VSNIAAGTEEQITMLMKNRRTMEKIVEMSISERYEVRKEALWVISNIFTTGTDHHVRTLVNLRGLEALAGALGDVQDAKILVNVMDAVDKVMEVGAKANINYSLAFDEAHGIEYLEHLQQHDSLEVYEKALAVIELHFRIEDDEEEENVAPKQENGMFSFGINESAKQLFPEQEGAVDPDSCYSSVLGTSRFDQNADCEMNY
jgi:importin subunit alpha-6/7